MFGFIRRRVACGDSSAWILIHPRLLGHVRNICHHIVPGGSTSLRPTRFILRPHFLPHHRKYSHGYKRNEDDNDNKYRKRKECQEGHIHLFKSRGQHILTNQRVLDSIVQKSDIKSTDRVLEIGPGTGNLTLKLLEVAKHVIAVEIDKRMIEILNNRVAEHGFEDRLTVICKDVLKTEFPEFDLVVANIPYGISSPLLAKLVFGASKFGSLTLLLQKEFARRLLANPGDSDFNRLAVNVKLVADVKFVMHVSKRDFLPCPKVDSSVVKIYPKSEIPDVDLDEWGAFTRTCFSTKNKTLGATLTRRTQRSYSTGPAILGGSNFSDYTLSSWNHQLVSFGDFLQFCT